MGEVFHVLQTGDVVKGNARLLFHLLALPIPVVRLSIAACRAIGGIKYLDLDRGRVVAGFARR